MNPDSQSSLSSSPMEQQQQQPLLRRSSRLQSLAAAAGSQAISASSLSSPAVAEQPSQKTSVAASRESKQASGGDSSLCARFDCDPASHIHAKACRRVGDKLKRLFVNSVEAALKHYNEALGYKNDSKFELVERTDLGRPFQLGVLHVNFLAKRKNAPPAAEPARFFAEVEYGNEESIIRVTRCWILEGKNRAGGDCLICDAFCYVGKVQHPRHGRYAKYCHVIRREKPSAVIDWKAFAKLHNL